MCVIFSNRTATVSGLSLTGTAYRIRDSPALSLVTARQRNHRKFSVFTETVPFGSMDRVRKTEKANGNLLSHFNYPVEFSDDNLKAGIQLPGWSYGDYGCNGKLALWCIAKTAAVTWLHAKQETQYGRNYRSTDMVVMAGLTMDLSRRIHNNAGMIYPMVLSSKVASITSESSYQMKIDIQDRHPGGPLASIIQQLVVLNSRTKKRTTIPAGLMTNRDRYSTAKSLVIPIPDIPKQTFRTHMRVLTSDIDNFYHTNHTSYLRMGMDALYEAWRARVLTFDPDLHEVRRTETRFLRETFAGDDLTLNVWCDNEEAYIVHVIIQKCDDMIVYTSFQFYPPELRAAHL